MKRKRAILLVVLGVVVIAIGAGVVGVRTTVKRMEKSLELLTRMTISDVDLSKIPDGTYTGSYEVFPVSAEVKVTVAGHKITGIELVKHRNGQGKGAEVIPGKVVEAQTLQVDIVSGATYSSKVILKAIENALRGAK